MLSLPAGAGVGSGVTAGWLSWFFCRVPPCDGRRMANGAVRAWYWESAERMLSSMSPFLIFTAS